MKKLKRPLAILAVLVLLSMYIMTFIFALMKSEQAAALFRGALACTILVPVLLYAFLLIARTIRPRKSPVTDTIILDVGNVLIRFGWREYASRLGMDEKEVRTLSEKVVGSPVWNELDTDLRPIEEITEELAALMPEQADAIRHLVLELDECLIPFDYAADWITGMRAAGYRVLFLSNWSRRAYERMKGRGQLDFEERTDGGIWSFRVHLAKPDPAIYRRLIKDYELDPARCLFIDDNADNIKAARSVGLPAYQFTDYPACIDALKSLDIRW